MVPEVRVWNLRLETYHGGLIWRFMMAVFGVSDSFDLVWFSICQLLNCHEIFVPK